MRYFSLFAKTKRESPKDETAINAQLLIRAGFVDKLMAGVYSFLPLGFRVLKKIENIIREEMVGVGGLEILLPTLQPKENWERTGRWEIYDSLFKFTSFYTRHEYALGPTHEEIVSPLMGRFTLSYKDLPFAVFQIQNKFRDEARAKSGLLRGREFLMKDLYSFHADRVDLDRYYESAQEAYVRIFKKAGLGHVTHLTFASGGSFSKYSHEFQTLTAAGEDIIYICDGCSVAVNKEIIEDQKWSCPKCGAANLREEKAVEVGNIFKLGTKYSSPFELRYKDEKGGERDVEMGCYGIGVNRLMGAIVEVHHDDRGIVWPASVAPFRVHMLTIGGEENVRIFADEAYKTLSGKGIEVFYDDRREVSAGEKFADADLMGMPYRMVVSEKTVAERKAGVKRRDEERERVLTLDEFIGDLKIIM